MPYKIDEVADKSSFASFVRLPWDIYRYDENWVAPLIGEEYALHNKEKHPFWKHAKSKYFIAVDKGKVLGRIVGIIDSRFNEFHNVNWGYWGFFECIQNESVAGDLFNHVGEWLKKQGVTKAVGPMNPSTNYLCGTLVEGFDTPPVVMMTYNPRYYPEFFEKFGFEKAKDLYAWLIDTPQIPERLNKLAKYALEKADFTVRKLDFSKLDREIDLMLSVYNKAWERNWGFVPMTEEEFRHTAKSLKIIADKDLIFIAEYRNQPVGFSLALPDINQALIHIRNGRLFPFGIFKLLYYKRKTRNMRVITMGVIEGFRNRGIDLIFYYNTFVEGIKKGYRSAECSWILEDNVTMNRVLEDIGAKLYKKYRLYFLPL